MGILERIEGKIDRLLVDDPEDPEEPQPDEPDDPDPDPGPDKPPDRPPINADPGDLSHADPGPPNTLPLDDYMGRWKDHPGVLAHIPLDSWENIWQSRASNKRVGRNYFYKPGYGMGCAWTPGTRSISPQYRINWEYAFQGRRAKPYGPNLTPPEPPVGLVTVVVRANYAFGMAWGGKHFQYSREGDLMYEFQKGRFGSPHIRGYFAPKWRTYGDPVALHPGGSKFLGYRDPPTASKANKHMGLHPQGYRADEHYSGMTEEQLRELHLHPTDRRGCYMVRLTNQWHTFAVTFDYREEPHRFSLWCASQGDDADGWPATPPTPVVADPDDTDKGLIFQMRPRNTPVTSFWFEFNNSSTVSPHAGTMYFRDFLAIEGVTAQEVLT